MERWRIRRTRNGSGWNVWEPNGEWSGYFETWAEAMSWAINPIARLEYWLASIGEVERQAWRNLR